MRPFYSVHYLSDTAGFPSVCTDLHCSSPRPSRRDQTCTRHTNSGTSSAPPRNEVTSRTERSSKSMVFFTGQIIMRFVSSVLTFYAGDVTDPDPGEGKSRNKGSYFPLQHVRISSERGLLSVPPFLARVSTHPRPVSTDS